MNGGKMTELEKRLEELEELNIKQAQVIAHQAELIKQLQAQLGQNSSNSHKPPSTDDPKQRAERRKRRKKAKSARKKGGQPGRKGKHRRLVDSEKVDDVVSRVPDECKHCQATLSGVDPRPQRHQIAESPPIKPHVTEYQLHKLKYQQCGKSTRTTLPTAVSQSTFGPRLGALVTSLRMDSRLSLTRTKELLLDVFGLKISRGSLSNLDGRSSQLLKAVSEAGGKTKRGGIGREVLKHFDSLWTFLDHEGIEPTNNEAERTLRHPVILRRLSFGSQSDRGLRFMERALSVRETLRRQDRSFYNYLASLWDGTPDPILLPAPS